MPNPTKRSRPPPTASAVEVPDRAWSIEKLSKGHDRNSFDCGVSELDEYLRRFARQNEAAGISQHFVALEAPDALVIHGYYALSAGAVAFDHVPRDLRKRVPRYPVPVAHLGRLAVDRSLAGQRLGEFLLMDALARTMRAADQIGIHAVEVVAINESARSFYLKYGFHPLKDDRNHLYLPIATVKKLGLV